MTFWFFCVRTKEQIQTIPDQFDTLYRTLPKSSINTISPPVHTLSFSIIIISLSPRLLLFSSHLLLIGSRLLLFDNRLLPIGSHPLPIGLCLLLFGSRLLLFYFRQVLIYYHQALILNYNTQTPHFQQTKSPLLHSCGTNIYPPLLLHFLPTQIPRSHYCKKNPRNSEPPSGILSWKEKLKLAPPDHSSWAHSALPYLQSYQTATHTSSRFRPRLSSSV